MKRFSALYLVPLLPFLGPGTALAEVEGDIPLGLEAVTGVRSDYVYRGFNLAGSLLDFQLEGEVALRDDLFLNAGGWAATEIGDDFAEGAAFLDLRFQAGDQFTLGGSATYHAYDHAFFENGVDVGAFFTWFAGEDVDLTIGAHRDFGADAWYAKAETSWSRRLSDDAFLAVSGGLSVVDGYYGRSGWNDVFGRASVTYNVNRSVSLTPFVGWSLEIEDGDGDEVFGGLWFEVSF